jgi:hypothetical protein
LAGCNASCNLDDEHVLAGDQELREGDSLPQSELADRPSGDFGCPLDESGGKS